MIARFKSRTLAPSVWQPTALKPVVPVLRDRCFECVHVYIVIVVSKCVCHLHNKELLFLKILLRFTTTHTSTKSCQFLMSSFSVFAQTDKHGQIQSNTTRAVHSIAGTQLMSSPYDL